MFDWCLNLTIAIQSWQLLSLKDVDFEHLLAPEVAHADTERPQPTFLPFLGSNLLRYEVMVVAQREVGGVEVKSGQIGKESLCVCVCACVCGRGKITWRMAQWR